MKLNYLPLLRQAFKAAPTLEWKEISELLRENSAPAKPDYMHARNCIQHMLDGGEITRGKDVHKEFYTNIRY